MRNLTATICLTIAVLLGSVGVSWSAGKKDILIQKLEKNSLFCIFDKNYADPLLAGQTAFLNINSKNKFPLTLQYSRKGQSRIALWKQFEVYSDSIVGKESFPDEGNTITINRFTGAAVYERNGMRKIYRSDPNKFSKAKNLIFLKMSCSNSDKIKRKI